MKELDPVILLAVFQEMLGPLLWILLAVVILGLLAFAVLLVREKGLVSRRLVRSEALGLIGGALTLVLMAKVSSSGFTDAAGPADWLLIALVFGVGLVGSTLLIYTVAGWWTARRRPAATLHGYPVSGVAGAPNGDYRPELTIARKPAAQNGPERGQARLSGAKSAMP